MKKKSIFAITVLGILFVLICLGIMGVELKTDSTIFSASEWINFFITYLSFSATMMLGLISYTLAKTAYTEEQILTKKVTIQSALPELLEVRQQREFGYTFDPISMGIYDTLYMAPHTWIESAKTNIPDDRLNWPILSGNQVVSLREKLEEEGILSKWNNAYFEFNVFKLVIPFQVVSSTYPFSVKLKSVHLNIFSPEHSNSEKATFVPITPIYLYPEFTNDNVWTMPINLAMPNQKTTFNQSAFLRFNRGLLSEDEFRNFGTLTMHLCFDLICDNVVTAYDCQLILIPPVCKVKLIASIFSMGDLLKYRVKTMKLFPKKPYTVKS